MKLKQTPLYQKHLENNGRMVNFNGWALPVEYKSALLEAKQVRMSCGMFDASHMGQFLIEGAGAFSFLQNLTTNNISLINQGQMQYSLFLNKQGGVIDDFMLYNLGEKFMCVVNASNKDKVFSWLKENSTDGIQLIDRSKDTALISIQGPRSAEVIAKTFDEDTADIEYMHFSPKKIKGVEFFISRSGYTGEDGFEIYTPWAQAVCLWDSLLEKGKAFGLIPCGLGSRDILRIEAGYPLYGHEIDVFINPYQARLSWAVKLDKNFIGKTKLLEIKGENTTKRIGFVMQERAFPRPGYSICSGESEIGKVSSGAYSPNKNSFIGMAYVEKDYAGIGRKISIKIRDRLYKAEVTKFPFVEIRTKNTEKIRI